MIHWRIREDFYHASIGDHHLWGSGCYEKRLKLSIYHFLFLDALYVSFSIFIMTLEFFYFGCRATQSTIANHFLPPKSAPIILLCKPDSL